MPYFADEFVYNRLIVLYLIDRLHIEITADVLYRVMAENGCMNFFDFYTTLYELESDGYVLSVDRACGRVYLLSPSGQEALKLFEETVPYSQRAQMAEYAKTHAEALRIELQYAAHIEHIGNGYRVQLKVFDRNTVAFEVSLVLPDSRTANLARKNWPHVAPEIYPLLFDRLTRDPDENPEP